MEMPRQAVIITGANGGIGEALVHYFFQQGYFVLGTDVQAKISDNNQNHCFSYFEADLEQTVLDINQDCLIFKMIKDCLEAHDLQLSGLINNAAIQILSPSEKLTLNDWQKTLNINLLAPFFWTQQFLTELKNSNGSVVNISSIHARLTKKEFVAYATSKAALSGLTRNMAVDLAGKIRVNAIEPAAIETAMLKAGFEGQDKLYQALGECHPLGRIGDVKEVAKLAFTLINQEIGFLNGATVALDGGISNCLLDPILNID